MKKIIIPTLILSTVVLIGCTKNNSLTLENISTIPVNEIASIISVDDEGNTDINQQQLDLELAKEEVSSLTPEEKQGLLFMREEEKLARDIYAYLYDIWGQQNFINISASEQTHTEAVLSLLNYYSIEDPVSNNAAGEFSDLVLQELYSELKTQGEASLIEALKVGAAVEEIDILDLQKFLKDVSNENISLVYDNLLRGSRNHLRAYIRNLSRLDVEYVPQYLNQEAFDEIISGEIERGGNGDGQQSGRGRR